MRADATADDVPMMMCGAELRDADASRTPTLWRRYLTLMLDGLRAS